MEDLTTRQVLVVTLIYTLATIPWLGLILATLRGRCEGWVLRTVVICSLLISLIQ